MKSINNSKLLVFDLGKVFVDFDYKIPIKQLAKRCALSEEEIYKRLIKSPLFMEFESGLISTAEFLKKAKEISGFNGEPEELIPYLLEHFRPITLMIDLHRQCKALGYKTFLFSNTNELVIAYFRKVFPFINEFDGHIFSYEYGCMKPDSRLYKILEKKSGYSGDKIVYIDDISENINEGLKFGWQAFVHKDYETTKNHLIELGILPDSFNS